MESLILWEYHIAERRQTMENTEDTILVFESKELCYQSSSCFLQEICKELMQEGIKIEYCKLYSLEKQQDQLMSYIGKTYRAIIDMNSTLVLAFVEEKQEYLFNLIHAPFYHILVDHPMHMHEKLEVPLHDYHVICIDSYHAAYINKTFSHIKEVLVVPYAGIVSQRLKTWEERCDTSNRGNPYEESLFKKQYEQRKIAILFPATYMPESYYLKQLASIQPAYETLAQEMYERIASSCICTYEEAYQEIRKDHPRVSQLLGEDGNRCREVYRVMNRYIRARLRERIVIKLLQAELPVTLVGANLEHCNLVKRKNVQILHEVSYLQQLNLMADSKIVFNMQPLFLDGPHDRVMNGMRNGAAVLTDSCHFIKKHFIQDKEYLHYKRNTPEQIPIILRNWIDNPEELTKLAYCGYIKVRKEHTIKQRVENEIHKSKQQQRFPIEDIDKEQQQW